MEEFLKIEYETSCSLLKYYDERHMSLVKFTTGVSSTIISLVFGFHALGASANQYFWHFTSVLTGIAGLGLLAIFIAMVQNRLYFVYPARQANAIRSAMLANIATSFSNNQMYLTTDVRAFKLLSLHAILNLLVAMQVGGLLAFCWFSVVIDVNDIASSIAKAVAVAAGIALLLFGLSAIYLTNRGRYHPDKSVHGVGQ